MEARAKANEEGSPQKRERESSSKLKNSHRQLGPEQLASIPPRKARISTTDRGAAATLPSTRNRAGGVDSATAAPVAAGIAPGPTLSCSHWPSQPPPRTPGAPPMPHASPIEAANWTDRPCWACR